MGTSAVHPCDAGLLFVAVAAAKAFAGVVAAAAFVAFAEGVVTNRVVVPCLVVAACRVGSDAVGALDRQRPRWALAFASWPNAVVAVA